MKNSVNEKPDMNEKIKSLATDLRLQAFQNYTSYIDNQMETKESIYTLLMAENEIKQRNKYKYRIKNASFPVIKTLDTFEFDKTRLPNLDKDLVMEIATCEFIKNHRNLVAIGSCGTGKSHLCTAISIEAIIKGYSVKFKRVSDLVSQLTEAANQKRLSQFIKKVNSCDVLYLDEFGYLNFDKEGASLLFQIFAARYETKSTIVTSNLEFSKWIGILGKDEHMTSALVGRLIHGSFILNMNGDDYRLHNKFKRNVDSVSS
jgi:DNA replication protein DnaC